MFLVYFARGIKSLLVYLTEIVRLYSDSLIQGSKEKCLVTWELMKKQL